MIKLNDKYEIYITDLYQTNIYRGLIMGVPTKNMNDRYIDGAEEKTKELFGSLASPFHLIKPERTLHEELDKDKPKELIERFGESESIPQILSIALMESYKTVKDHDEMYSACAVAWFQDEIGIIDESVFEGLDWEAIAKDCTD